MNANELADELDYCYGKEYPCPVSKEAATMLRKLDGQLAFRIDAVTKYQAKVEEQQAEIEALNELNTMLKDAIEKRIEMDANRFIQNFAEEQHQRAVALEMRELTDEEIEDECRKAWGLHDQDQLNLEEVFKFARAILRKASEK